MKFQAEESDMFQQRILALLEIAYLFVLLIGKVVNVVSFEFLESESGELEVKRNVLSLV